MSSGLRIAAAEPPVAEKGRFAKRTHLAGLVKKVIAVGDRWG